MQYIAISISFLACLTYCNSGFAAESNDAITPSSSSGYPYRVASCTEIRACFEEVKNERGSVIIGGQLWQRLCVQASKDPSFDITSISEPIVAMECDNKGGLIADHEGALAILNLLNYIPWNGNIKRGEYATYFRVHLNGLSAKLYIDRLFDSARRPVYMPSLTYPSTETFNNDVVRRTEVENAYKALYEKMQGMLATENDH